jgi:hypothetical protein
MVVMLLETLEDRVVLVAVAVVRIHVLQVVQVVERLVVDQDAQREVQEMYPQHL